MLKNDEMPAEPTTESRSFLVYNPGTETCETLIRIGGTVGTNGVTIKNDTNNTECKQLSLPSDGYLEIDSFHGEVVRVNGIIRVLEFEHHDEGYMTLASFGEKLTEVMATTTAGSQRVPLSNCKVDDHLIGKYIRLNNDWIKIEAVEDNTITLASAAAKSETVTTKITGMNEITVSGDGLTINQFEIDYYPMIK